MPLETRSELNPVTVYSKFLELFDSQPLLVRSPGRINLIGEHTDYNDGFVMPAAIDRQIVVAMDIAADDHSTLYSVKHNEFFSFHTTNPERVSSPLWANYVLGVVRKFLDLGKNLKPFNCVIDGDVPTGAGLSSSAALECSFAFALNHQQRTNISRKDLILISQWSEHNFAGVKCGIMDQFASMMGQKGKAFVLDCRSLEHKYYPVDLTKVTIVLCDSMVKHSLASSEYNTRRAECEEGVSLIRKHHPEVAALRDVTIDMLSAHQQEFSTKVYNRCLYVVEENQRVLDASNDLAQGNLEAFGKKMYLTHEGLSNLYEVSCEELDFLVSESKKINGVMGSRMMGGGFGGCTINFVVREEVKNFIAAMQNSYHQKYGVTMNTYVVSIADGTSIIKP
jgi:galactokinase